MFFFFLFTCRPDDIILLFQHLETWSLQFGSHPNLYVLDTPGILRPEIAHYHSGAKLALAGLKLPELLSCFLFLAGSVNFLSLSTTGAIKDNLLDEHELARYFLAILNLSEEYKQWVMPKDTTDGMLGSLEKHRKKGQYASDFTQVSRSKVYLPFTFKIIKHECLPLKSILVSLSIFFFIINKIVHLLQKGKKKSMLGFIKSGAY